MLWRLFSKAKSIPDRVHYRMAPSRADGVGVQIVSGEGHPISGRLVNMSAGGAAIEFDESVERDLQLGVERQITFSSLNSAPIRIRGVVRSLPSPEEPDRYGFQFTEEVELDEATHGGFLRLFNRRKDRRARPGLDERLRARIIVNGVSHDVPLHDISLGGANLRIPAELGLGVGSEFEFHFSIPRTNHSLVCFAEVRNVTTDALGLRAGVVTTVVPESDTKRNIDRAYAALADYIERRVSDMERYNSAFE